MDHRIISKENSSNE